MPLLTRWFLRAAMVHLVLALVLGLVLAVPSMTDVSPGWRFVYVHLIVMGWATQMIFGVALWMFPRRKPLDLLVVDWAGWTCFATMNAGLLLRAVAEPIQALARSPSASIGLLVSAVLQLTAVAAFVVLIWPRVTGR